MVKLFCGEEPRQLRNVEKNKQGTTVHFSGLAGPLIGIVFYSTSPMDINELYKVNRSQIEHVDNTISQRIVWLVISQSFFFSGFSVLITGSPSDMMLIGKQHMLVTLFPISAIIMNLVSFVDIICGMVYLKKLSDDFDKKNDENKTELFLPPINGFKKLNQLKNLSAVILPSVFIIIWIIVLVG